MQNFEREVIDRLSNIERGQADMYRLLFGDGQPGVVQQLQRRVEEHERFRTRITVTNSFVSGIVSFVVGMFVALHDHILSR